MTSQGDSSENDIWDYQPVLKKRGGSLCSTHVPGKPVKKNSFPTSAKSKISLKSQELDQAENVVTSSKNSHSIPNWTSQNQVIDVELEPDFELPSSVKGKPTKVTGTSLCNESDTNFLKCSRPSLLSSKSSFFKPLPNPTESSTKDVKRLKLKQSKSECSTKSPVRKARRFSENKATSKEESRGSIKTYFSPTKQKGQRHPMTDPLGKPGDLSDDDLIILSPSANDVNIKFQSSPVVASCVADSFQSRLNQDDKKDNKLSDNSVKSSPPSFAATSETGPEVSKSLEIPIVDVDIVWGRNVEASSLENKDHSLITLPSENEKKDTASFILEKCLIENGDSLFCNEDKSEEDNYRSVQYQSATKKVVDEGKASSTSEASESRRTVCETFKGGGFLIEESSSDTGSIDGEIEKDLNFSPTNSTKQSDMVKCDIGSEQTIRDTQNGNALKSKSVIVSGREEIGGFLSDSDPLTDNLYEPEIEKTEASSKSANEKMIEMPYSLSTSASWPSVPSSTAKQTTLFTFLKSKSGGSAESLGASARPQFLSLESSSLNATSQSRRKNGPFKSISDSSVRSSSAKTPWKKLLPSSSAENIESNEEESQGGRKKKQCPFYKKIPGTSITVDAFRYGIIPGCEAYVLTHFHYDHYGGLTKKFTQPIFCSQVTGNLVESRIGVDKRWINRLPMWQPCKVADITLTLMEANHCPGAVIILFELKDGKKILHTGDFRANQDMESYTALQDIKIAELYLDTTYCNPSYAFPAQSEVIHFVVDLVLNHISDEPSTLIVCGAYTIGKERIFTAIARALDSKICVMNDKKKVLDCLEDADLKSRVTLDWQAGRVHVLPMGKLNQQHLKEHHARHSRYKSVLAFQPTGWTHSDKQASLSNLKPKWSTGGITLYGVPYSEHSSYLEMKRFVQHFRPLKILPTVNNGNPASRNKMETIFKEWKQEKKHFK